MNWRVKALDLARKTDQEKMYKENLSFQYKGDTETIKKDMGNGVLEIFNHHINHNPKYIDFLKSKGFDLSKKDFKQVDIPIITKDDLKEFYPIIHEYQHSFCHTGGSTSEPFEYPLSKKAASALWANLWTAFQFVILNLVRKCYYYPGMPAVERD